MRWIRRIALGSVALVALAVGGLFAGFGPVAALPGGVLWGPVLPAPADWSFTDAIAEIQIQTHVGPLPWAVTTWVLSDGGELYVAAGACDRIWTRRVLADPEVRVRVDGNVYRMRASIERSRDVGARLAPVVLHKYYGVAVDSGNWIEGATNGCVFRVEPRS